MVSTTTASRPWQTQQYGVCTGCAAAWLYVFRATAQELTIGHTHPLPYFAGPTALATVAGIQSCTVHLPKFLPQFEKILEALAGVEPQHTAAVMLGDPCDTRRQKRSRDSKTRTVTATMDF